MLAAAKQVSRESVVRIAGMVKAIDKAPGGRELVPDLFEIISLADSPLPLDVVEKVPADLDTRLDARFLDARRPGSLQFSRSAALQLMPLISTCTRRASSISPPPR